jgi:hypothetical protein
MESRPTQQNQEPASPETGESRQTSGNLGMTCAPCAVLVCAIYITISKKIVPKSHNFSAMKFFGRVH